MLQGFKIFGVIIPAQLGGFEYGCKLANNICHASSAISVLDIGEDGRLRYGVLRE
jgi:hypothetical protein